MYAVFPRSPEARPVCHISKAPAALRSLEQRHRNGTRQRGETMHGLRCRGKSAGILHPVADGKRASSVPDIWLELIKVRAERKGGIGERRPQQCALTRRALLFQLLKDSGQGHAMPVPLWLRLCDLIERNNHTPQGVWVHAPVCTCIAYKRKARWQITRHSLLGTSAIHERLTKACRMFVPYTAGARRECVDYLFATRTQLKIYT